MPSRLAPAATFIGFALVAAALQVLATLLLGLAPVDAIQRAAGEGSRLYLIGAFGTGVAMMVLWTLRRRPLLASAVFLTLELGLMLSIVTRTSRLGLAYHGEFILHHFTAFLCAAACISLGWTWSKQARLGPARWIAAGPAFLGGLGLLGVHTLEQPGVEIRLPTEAVETLAAVAVLAPAIALAALWKHTRDARVRVLAIAIQVPLLLRVAMSFPESLTGASVPDGARQWVMLAVIAAALVSFWAFRPDMPRPVRFIVIMLSALATSLLYLVYRRGFGQLEDGIGGLAQSLFGFSLPYPSYVPGWKIITVCLALFCIFSVVYGGLLSWDERIRGLALGLFAVTGIGLSNAQLVLMASAALLLVVHTLLDEGGSETLAAPFPVEDVLRDAARSVGLPAPVVLETAEGSVVSVRGDLDGSPIDLRARPAKTGTGTWRLTLRAGIMGRGRPNVELTPDRTDAGQRPAHEIARTHRVRGEARVLEDLDDEQLDALTPFATATAKFWDAGIEVELGSDLSGLDGDRLGDLLRASAAVGG